MGPEVRAQNIPDLPPEEWPTKLEALLYCNAPTGVEGQTLAKGFDY